MATEAREDRGRWAPHSGHSPVAEPDPAAMPVCRVPSSVLLPGPWKGWGARARPGEAQQRPLAMPPPASWSLPVSGAWRFGAQPPPLLRETCSALGLVPNAAHSPDSAEGDPLWALWWPHGFPLWWVRTPAPGPRPRRPEGGSAARRWAGTSRGHTSRAWGTGGRRWKRGCQGPPGPPRATRSESIIPSSVGTAGT